LVTAERKRVEKAVQVMQLINEPAVLLIHGLMCLILQEWHTRTVPKYMLTESEKVKWWLWMIGRRLSIHKWRQGLGKWQ